MKLRLFLLSSCFLLPASLVLAQSIPTGTSGLILTASTDNPAPGQQVTITAKNYSSDINSAILTWTTDGRQSGKGSGLTTLVVTAPPLGKIMTVGVTAAASDGTQTSSSITISSGSVDMILETDGYTPPFFPGKIPLVYQNTVTVIAIPHLSDASGKEYDPKKLVYQWKKDSGAVLSDQSGYGKQSISLPGELIPRSYYLIVDVYPPTGPAKAEGIVEIAPREPSLNFYVDDPLYGPLYNKAVSSVHIGSQKETSILAVPYGFNGVSSNKGTETSGGISLNWSVNGSSHPELSFGKSIVLRAPDGTAGSSNIGLKVTGIGNILQAAELGFSAIFSAGTASSTPASQVTF